MKRRQFLKNTIPATVLPSLINGMTFNILDGDPKFAALFNAYVETDRTLVIIQLVGGNDGLNTLIPVDQYGNYFNARSNIAIPENSALAITGVTKTKLHPALTGLQSLYNEGKLNIVQAAGYPNPNFSHFRSTDIWMSASGSDKEIPSGWIGRYLNDQYPNYPVGYPNSQMPDPLGMQIGYTTSLTFLGPVLNMGLNITRTSSVQLVTGIEDPAPSSPSGDALKYVRLIAKQSNQYSSRILEAYNTVSQQSIYPTDNGLGDQLKIVARLIKGGLKTRVYMVTLSKSFDTHSNQANTLDITTGVHASLLKQLGDAIKAFQDDLKELGIEDRVLGMTFSEFGRRIKSNGSMGTDHGAAAPMFIFGKKVNPGITGNNPIIGSSVTVNDNIPMQYDFRSVYASLLQDWFCVDNTALQTIMLQNFQKLNLCTSGTCVTTAVRENETGISLVSNYPNPFTETTTISFTTKGGHTLIQIMDALGRVIRTPVDRNYMAGTYKTNFDSYGLPAGVYYARFQNGITQQVKPMLKVR